MEFRLEEGRTNSTVISTNTPWLKTHVMAQSNTIKKPRHQGKEKVTLYVKQKKAHKEKEQQIGIQ